MFFITEGRLLVKKTCQTVNYINSLKKTWKFCVKVKFQDRNCLKTRQNKKPYSKQSYVAAVAFTLKIPTIHSRHYPNLHVFRSTHLIHIPCLRVNLPQASLNIKICHLTTKEIHHIWSIS